jgi:thiamine biosynthesis protein ThiS
MTDATDSRLLAVRINGDAREVPGGLTVDALLAHLGLDLRLVVVERNGVILRRDDLAGAAVEAGDVYELVHFVGGG